MTVLNSTCQNPMDLTGHLRNFVCGYRPYTFDRTTDFSGTGDGDLNAFGVTNANAAVETWTITCTDATTEGAEVWSVVGSVAGSISTNYVSNTLFDTSGVQFIIVSASSAAFSVADAYTVAVNGTGLMQTSGESATLEQHQYTNSEYIFAATFPGLGGYKLSVIIGGQNGLNARVSFKATPEWVATGGDIYTHDFVNTSKKYLYAVDSVLEYWVTADVKGFNLVVKSGTYYRHAMCRYGIPFGNPAQYRYPVVVAAETVVDTYDAGRVADGYLSFYPDPAFQSLEAFDRDNTWKYFNNYVSTGFSRSWSTNNRTSPYAGITASVQNSYLGFAPNLNSEYLLMPIRLLAYEGDPAFLRASHNCALMLELEGVAAVPDQNVLASEDTVSYAGDTWIVFQNIDKTSDDNFMALKWV